MKTDVQIKNDVIDELEWDAAVDAAEIGIHAENGVVTLSGYLSSYPEKLAAERAAQRVSGVKAVAMDVEVKLPGSYRHDDTEIAEAAIYALKWNALVPDGHVKVLVENGIITLSGELPWSYQRAAAESAVRNLNGVKGVLNMLRIVPKTSTTGLRTKIEAALQRAAHFDARDISITVDAGKVTLNGRVRSLGQRRLIEQAVLAAPGVTDLVDHLSVES